MRTGHGNSQLSILEHLLGLGPGVPRCPPTSSPQPWNQVETPRELLLTANIFHAQHEARPFPSHLWDPVIPSLHLGSYPNTVIPGVP